MTMIHETWRVVCSDGKTRSMVVEEFSPKNFCFRYTGSGYTGPDGHGGIVWGRTRREVVLNVAHALRWKAIEVIGPKALSIAEAVAAERARCAAVCRLMSDSWANEYGEGGESSGYSAALACALRIERGQ